MAQDRAALGAPPCPAPAQRLCGGTSQAVVLSRRLPASAACCTTHLLEKIMFCKAFPSPGYAKCWPKPQCAAQCYHPTSLPPWLLPQHQLPMAQSPLPALISAPLHPHRFFLHPNMRVGSHCCSSIWWMPILESSADTRGQAVIP